MWGDALGQYALGEIPVTTVTVTDSFTLFWDTTTKAPEFEDDEDFIIAAAWRELVNYHG